MAEEDDQDEFESPQAEPSSASAPQPENIYAKFVAPKQEENIYAKFAAPKQEENIYAQFVKQPGEDKKQPEAESPFWSGVREFAHEAIPSAVGGFAGVATTAATSPFITPAGGIVAGIGTGFGAAEATRPVVEWAAKNLLGIDDAQQRAVNAQTNPKSTFTGGVATQLVPFGVGRAAVSVGQRVLGGGLGGAFETGRELYEGENLDPAKIGIATGAGAVAAQPRAPLTYAETQAAKLAARIRPISAEPIRPAADPMPDTGGVAKSLATPPSGEEPHNTVRYGKEAPPQEPGGGVNVGEDPTLTAAIDATKPPPAPGAEAVPPPEVPSGLQGPQPGLRAVAERMRQDRLAGPEPAEPPGVRTATPEIDEAVGRATAREPQQQQQEQPSAFMQEQAQRYPGVQRLLESQGYRTGQATAKQGRQQAPEPGGPRLPPPSEPPPPPPPGGEPPLGPETVRSALEPATASDKAQGILASLRRGYGALVGVQSESGKIAGAALREAYGPLARLKEQTFKRFSNDMHQLANRMDQPTFERFVDAYETGKVSTLPKDQQELAQTLQKNYGDFWKEIEKLPTAEKMEAVKNYLTHMYDNTNGAVDKFTSDWFGAGGGSLRKRTHPTFADARAAGLQPLSTNPIEHFVRYSEGISHNLAQRRMMADLETQNRVGYFGPKVVGASGTPSPQVRGEPPEGYAKIEVPWAEKNGRSAYAPRDIADTINQFYSAGLRRAQTKDIYEFLQHTKNMWTAVELGLSAYHATTMSVEAMASGMGRAMQLAASGQYAKATKQLLTSPGEFVTAALTGKTGRQIYRDTSGTAGSPLQRRIIDLFARANVQPGNLRVTGEYDMTKLGNFWDASKRGSLPNEIQAQIKSIGDSYGLKLPGVLLENVRRAMQTLSKPLFEHYIPALKLGTMMKDMEAWMHANPNATDAQAMSYARKISDSVDNRMGEMNYNNLFMNKTAKDAGMLALRSFGFTVGGPMREVGAGAGRLAATAAQLKNPLKHLDLRSDATDPRTAYAAAFLPTIFAISAAYQYLRTGKGPEDWRDLVTPQTGGTIESMKKQVPERILVPGYHKDFLGYFVNPVGPAHELQAKLAAPWTALAEQLTGKDWRDKPYVPRGATALDWLKAHGQQLGSHMAPIGPKQLYEGTKKGSQLTVPEQMLGVRTPGAYMLNPKGFQAFLDRQRPKQQKQPRAAP